MDKLYIIIPAYNESANIVNTINDWYPVAEKINCDSRLVIVNDGSTDNTLSILENQKKQHPLLEVLTKKNGGHGSAVYFGYQYALAHDADFIFQTDSDGQTDPLEFMSFWKLRNEYSAVFGNRIVRGDGKDRAFVEHILCLILKVIFKVKIPDSNAPFRLMNANYLRKYLSKINADYNLPNVMLTVYGAYYHEKIVFKEISFKPRQGGKNSINIKKIIQIGFQAVRDFKKFKKDM